MPFIEHDHLQRPADSDIIWRYLDFTKLVAMLETRSLYFANVFTLGDAFEGAVPPANNRRFASLPEPERQLQIERYRRGMRQSRPVYLFNPPRMLVWLSTNPTWEVAKSLSAPSAGGWAPLTMDETALNANGLYRIRLDSTVELLSWRDACGPQAQAAREFERYIKQRGAKPREWRFTTYPIPVAKWTAFQKWDRERATWLDEPVAGTAYREMIEEMIESAEVLLGLRKVTPPLVLLYSAIDMMAWLNIRDVISDTSSSSFVKLVNDFISPTGQLPQCSPDDLYGARCGLLHTRTPESRTARSGQARKLLYAYGSKTARELQGLIDTCESDEIPVHVDSLVKAVRLGLDRFADSLVDDWEHSAMVRFKAAKMLPTSEAAQREEKRLAAAQSRLIESITRDRH